MTVQRLCSKTACGRAASCTLTYNYAGSTIVLGPLAGSAEPHSYDLCSEHANRLTAPRGWDVLRLADDFPEPPPAPDELVAIADAVRSTRAAAGDDDPRAVIADASAAELLGRIRRTGSVGSVASVDVGRRRNLFVVPSEEDADTSGDPTDGHMGAPADDDAEPRG